MPSVEGAELLVPKLHGSQDRLCCILTADNRRFKPARLFTRDIGACEIQPPFRLPVPCVQSVLEPDWSGYPRPKGERILDPIVPIVRNHPCIREEPRNLLLYPSSIGRIRAKAHETKAND